MMEKKQQQQNMKSVLWRAASIYGLWGLKRLRLCAVASPLWMNVCVCVYMCVRSDVCIFLCIVHVYDVLLLFRLCDCKIVVLAASLLSFWYADGVYAAYSLLHQSEYNLSFIVVHSLIKLVSRLYRVYI